MLLGYFGSNGKNLAKIVDSMLGINYYLKLRNGKYIVYSELIKNKNNYDKDKIKGVNVPPWKTPNA